VSCIYLKKQTPIGLHFNQAGHSLKDFTILAIEAWQNILQTAHPLGINNFKAKLSA